MSALLSSKHKFLRTISADVCPLPRHHVNPNCLFLKKKKEKRKKERKKERKERRTRKNERKYNQDSVCRNTTVSAPQSCWHHFCYRKVSQPRSGQPEDCPETASSPLSRLSKHHIGSVFGEPLPHKGLLARVQRSQGLGVGMAR